MRSAPGITEGEHIQLGSLPEVLSPEKTGGLGVREKGNLEALAYGAETLE